MPGIIQGATSVLVLPQFLCLAFSQDRQYIAKINDYADGTSQRDLITFEDRRTWTLRPRAQNAVITGLRNFYITTFGATLPFYFYDFSESTPSGQVVWDGTGNATLGRFMVRFDGSWEQVLDKGQLITASCKLKELIDAYSVGYNSLNYTAGLGFVLS